MRLILVRHGKTEGNEKEILEGPEGKLSKTGKDQIKKLGLRLKSEKIDAIFSSPYRRASDTSEEIAKHHQGIKIIFSDELKEINRGSLWGKRYDDIDPANFPQDMEAEESLIKRSKKILDLAYNKYPRGTVLFSAHNTINKIITSLIINRDYREIKKKNPQSNTGVSIFDFHEDGSRRIILENCTSHLD
jgi:broad specificity phosphatase PhoE